MREVSTPSRATRLMVILLPRRDDCDRERCAGVLDYLYRLIPEGLKLGHGAFHQSHLKRFRFANRGLCITQDRWVYQSWRLFNDGVKSRKEVRHRFRPC